MRKRNKKTAEYLELLLIEDVGTTDGVEEIHLQTNEGTIITRFHQTPQESDTAVLWVGGAGGGLDGPAGGLYPRLATRLVLHNIASFRLHYRFPGYLEDCVMDTLLGIEYLKARNFTRMALVGHSFGGAVVINAGALSKEVVAVSPISTQTYGTALISNLSPKPVLFIHGTADEILPDTCSKSLYAQSGEPKELLLYPGCRHGLDECRQRIDEDLFGWLYKVLI